MSRVRSLFAKLRRYSLASIGPIGSALAQFALSMILLHKLDSTEFGIFSFLLIASQFSWGIWGALFCAPLPVLMTTGDQESRDKLLGCLLTTNLIAAVAAFVIFILLGISLGIHTAPAVLFAGYAAVALVRWVARAQAYAIGYPLRTTASDVLYSLVLIAGVLAVSAASSKILEIAFGALLISTTVALAPFGRAYLVQQFLRFNPREVLNYLPVWRQHSGWSLLGVLTTEATANAHVYIVTLGYGPTAYAPLAASALLIRPIQVAINALSEFERAQMAEQLGKGRLDLALASVRFFRSALIAGWVATAIAIAAILGYAPRLIFPTQYELNTLVVGASLWIAVAGVRLLRTPESILLQSAGAFRPLAFASVFSSGGSIFAVIALLIIAGPLWSIAGVLLGEMLFAGWIWRQAWMWRQNAHLVTTTE